MREFAAMALAAVVLTMAPQRTRADEGMWTFDDIPADRVERALGVHIDRPWLDHLRSTTVRLTTGCSGAVVSREGLVLTNDHCVLACEQTLSGPDADVISDGFLTDTRPEERVCPGVQAEILESITDVTEAIFASSTGKSGEDYVRSREAAIARAEHDACRGDARRRCQVISFYGGGLFKVYRFRRFADVRLVFAPEFAIGFFGGDADNFSFPRLDLDCAFLRLYENGRPAVTPQFLAWSDAPPKAGEAVFVAGSPAATERGFTLSQLETERDVTLPVNERLHADLRARLAAFAAQGPREHRLAADALFTQDNDLKVIRGRMAVLADPAFMAARAREEDALKSRLAVDAKLAAQVGDPWSDLAAIRKDYADNFIVWRQLESAAGGGSQLFAWARALVRGAAERARPNPQRLPEFADSRLPLVRKGLLDDRPVDSRLETLFLTHWLETTRDGLGADAAATRAFLGEEAPTALARRLAEGSRLGDPAVRRALWEGGLAAVERSDDPLIAYVLRTDPLSQAARRVWEDDVLGPTQTASERIARVRWAIEGAALYPDATFSPRLSFGKVEGWGQGESHVAPFTRFGELFARASGASADTLPPRWQGARGKLNPDTVFNFVTSNDITGGNSGSPVVDSRGRLLGTAFDGNQASIAGDFAYDARENRTVVVSTAAISEALARVYGRTALSSELTAQ
jgi:hypothetical protein